MRNIIKLLFVAILLALLSGCATLANLTGTRGCECSYNEQTGITKWSCASGATSDAAGIKFGPGCEFQAQAQGAQTGPSALDSRLMDAFMNEFIRSRIQIDSSQ